MSEQKKSADVSSTPTRVTLKAGTEIQVDGVSACLVGETEVETHDHELAVKQGDFAEYPKMVAGDKVVNSPEEEAAWLKNPLSDVSIEPGDDEAEPKKAKSKTAAHGGAKKK